jgi:transcriptional regulator with PAS, ATPase and Fis domain
VREAETTSPELARRSDGDVFRLTAPVLRRLAGEVAASGHVLSFFDAAGWMLWMGGCARNAKRLAEIGFRPGERCHAMTEQLTGAAGGSEPSWVGWVTSVAAIAGTSSTTPVGFAHVAAPAPLEKELVAASTIAHAIQERFRSAVAVREHVVAHSLRIAAAAQDPTFAVDAGGDVIGANDPARDRLALRDTPLPAPIRERLAALLAAPATMRGRIGTELDLDIEWPGETGRLKLVVSVIRFEDQAIGAVLRVARRGRPARAPRRGAPHARYGFDQIRGESEAIRTTVALARSAARNDLPVVLLGESGTGKELFAHAIHAASARGAGPLVAVNCGSIPASLLEAELFGYEPGTFTGGRSDGNPGKFERADGGTLLLDEISELSPPGQAALLRVLQEREVVRLGDSTPRPVDVRLIAATNKSLEAEIAAGRFRADLYFRLHVLAISVPPLRERREDVKLLAGAFLRDAAAEVGRSEMALSPAAVAALERHDWPGNVRELRNVFLRAAATAAGDVIEVRDLPDLPASSAGAPPREAPPGGDETGEERLGEREQLLRALASSSSWNLAHTASALHVSRTTLYRWLRKYHIAR